MNAILRHVAIRFWATALLGSVICMVVLPFWQSILKVQWVAIPVIFILGFCFVLLGWGMNRYGTAKIYQLINEAGAWERAGDRETAQETFDRAVALFDSFWLSPMGRHKIESMMTGRLARFYLSQPSSHPRAQLMVHQYIMRHPNDLSVVRSWLARVAADPHTHARHDVLAANISDALPDELDIQQLLTAYYLGSQRCDFDAMQTYQRLWRMQPRIADTKLHAMAHVLLKNNQLNDWALEVYLKGYESGDPYSLEGIAAANRYLRPHPGNRSVLARALTICESLEDDFIEKSCNRFKSLVVAEQPEPATPPTNKTAPGYLNYTRILADSVRLFTAAINQLLTWGRKMGSAMVGIIRGGHRTPLPVDGIQSVLVKFTIAGVMIAVAVGVTVLTGYRYQHSRKTNRAVPAVAETPLPKTDLPFTIQVAAYLKPEDAQRYVAQLNSQGLEAFSTQAVSARRKWYQVKLSRFETKRQAQLYGERLKSQGLIDDFYVANYQQPTSTP